MGLEVPEFWMRVLPFGWSNLFLNSVIPLPLLMPVRLATDLNALLCHVRPDLRSLHRLDTFREFRHLLIDLRRLHAIEAQFLLALRVVNDVLVGQLFKMRLNIDVVVMILLEPIFQRLHRVDKTVVSQLEASLVDAYVALLNELVHWGRPISQDVVCLIQQVVYRTEVPLHCDLHLLASIYLLLVADLLIGCETQDV